MTEIEASSIDDIEDAWAVVEAVTDAEERMRQRQKRGKP